MVSKKEDGLDRTLTEDQETGLHYNKQRYYDPARGEYLSPDPLGTPDGPNGYSYVRYNPLRYVDPEGLILFAFDGTENSDVPLAGSSISNVVQFLDLYNQPVNGAARYVTGVGTAHPDSQENGGPINAPAVDTGINRTGVARIDRMMLYM